MMLAYIIQNKNQPKIRWAPLSSAAAEATGAIAVEQDSEVTGAIKQRMW
jgi:hypothetical protein